MTQTLRFLPGEFFGGASVSLASQGVCVSHRIADRDPDEVLTHTHDDAHFILVTGGVYVSAAAPAAAGAAASLGSPPGGRPVFI